MKDKNGVGFIKTFDYSNHKFNFGQFLRSPIKLKKKWIWNIPVVYVLVKTLLVQLKNLYIQYALILIMEKRNDNQKCKRWKWGMICTNFLVIPTTSLILAQKIKLEKNLNLKFRSKFNHGFSNHGYIHCAALKSLYNFM